MERKEVADLIDSRLNAFAKQYGLIKEYTAPSGKTKVLVVITTFNRPDGLLRLLQDIKKNSSEFDIEVHVYDDASSVDNVIAVNYLRDNFKYHYVKFPRNRGKKLYYRTMNDIFTKIKASDFDYFFQLPDDVTLVPDFFKRSIDTWCDIEDFDKICLSTLLIKERLEIQNWVNFKPQEIFGVIHSQWNDMCYMCERRFFEQLDWIIHSIHPNRWHLDQHKSSGVGQQITQRLHALGLNMYHVWSSLVVMNDCASVMNTTERIKNPLTSLHREIGSKKKSTELVSTRRIVGIASIPKRKDALKKTIQSLVDQVDEIHVCLNGYDELPEYTYEFPKVTFYMDKGAMGDANKFKTVEQADGYYFSCDDDIIYPKDYIETIIRNIEAHDRKAIVTVHGRTAPSVPISNFYRGTTQYHCLLRQAEDIRVHMPGTGVTGFHTSTLPVKMGDFKVANMADIWMGLIAQRYQIPVICIAHAQGWIRAQTIKEDSTIYNTHRNRDEEQIKAVNSVQWRVYD